MIVDILVYWFMWVSFVVVVIIIVFYMLDCWLMELVLVSVIVVLLVLFSLFGVVLYDGSEIIFVDLLFGFVNFVLIMIMVLLVVG